MTAPQRGPRRDLGAYQEDKPEARPRQANTCRGTRAQESSGCRGCCRSQDNGTWCSIHKSSGHDLKHCGTVKALVEKQQAARGRKNINGCYNYGEEGHISKDCPTKCGDGQSGGRGGGRGRTGGGRGDGRGGQGERERPPRGHDNGANGQGYDEELEDDEAEEERPFQEARDAACVHGGAFLHSSNWEFK